MYINEPITSVESAESFLNRHIVSFGNIVRAVMKKTPNKEEYILWLYNPNGDVMVFNDYLTSGYNGAGSDATLRVLQRCGFDVTKNFIEDKANENFVLYKK